MSAHEPLTTHARLAPLAAALLAVVIYASTLGGTFIYDDIPVAQTDPRLTAPSLWHLYWTRDYYFDVNTGEGSIDNLYRPLVSKTYAIPAYLLGPVAWHQHLINVLLYAGCCALVARLGRILAGPVAGWCAGLLFAAHPVHAEAVCAIVGRAELMAMLGLIGAVTLHLSGPPSPKRTLAILACGVVALLSKEQGMLLPGLLLAAEPLRRSLQSAKDTALAFGGGGVSPPPPKADDPPFRPLDRSPSLAPLLIGVCFLCGGYIVLREQILGLKFWWDRTFLDPAVQPLIWAKGADRWLMPFELLGRYAQLLVFPVHLSFDYSGNAIGRVASLTSPYLWAGLAVAALGPLALIYSVLRKHWTALFLLAGFALTYGVISNLVSLIGVIFAERVIFTPSVFVVLGVAVVAAKLPRKAWLPGLAVLTLAGAVHAGVYASRWSDRLAFYEWSRQQQPRSMRLHQLVADELTRAGDLDRAARVAADGRAAMPDYWDIWIQSATIAEKQGRPEQALAFMTEAARLNPQVAAPALLQLQDRLRGPNTRNQNPASP